MPTFVGIVTTPNDGGTNGNAVATIDPSSLSMQAGDLVVVLIANRNGNASFTVGTTGGQTWGLGSNLQAVSQSSRAFWATYNGTWAANPSFNANSGSNTVPVTAQMLVFRPDAGVSGAWAVDVADDAAAYVTPASPFDVVRTGLTPLHNKAVAVSTFLGNALITWALQGSAGWANPGGTAQTRNTSGSDNALSTAYKILATPAATGNITNRQSAVAGGHFRIMSFYETTGGPPAPVVTDDGAVGADKIGAHAIGSDSKIEGAVSDFSGGEVGKHSVGDMVIGGPLVGATPSVPIVITTSPRFKLGAGAAPSSALNHHFIYSFGKDLAGGQTVDCTARLYDGTTLRAQRVHLDIGPTVQAIDSLLTTTEATFSGYSNLYVEFEFAKHENGTNRVGRVYWARLEVPDAGAPGTVTFTPASLPHAHSFSAPQTIGGPPPAADMVVVSGLAVSVLENPPLEIDDVIEERSTARFCVLDSDGTRTFVRGERVYIFDSTAARAFTGYVWEVSEVRINQAGARRHMISCVDNHYKADKRRVARSYTNETPAQIVADLITTYLEEEDVHLSDARIDS